MRQGGTRIYCPNCKKIRVCKAVSPTILGESKGRRWHKAKHQDISWFRRCRLCQFCKKLFLTAEVTESLLEELATLREKLAKRNRKVIDSIRVNRAWLTRNEIIPKELAEDFIKNTAWWHTHSSGQPVRAPNHYKRIEMTRHGWSIKFGANFFLVGAAIERCRNEIDNYFEKAINGELPSMTELKNKLKSHISGAVANHNGYEYDGYYNLQGPDMMFGAQSIDVDDGANFLISRSGIEELLSQ